MYKCLDCGHIFEKPKQYSEDCTPYGAFEGGSFIRYYTVCPYCQSEGYLEAKKCDCCNEYFFEEELTDEGCCKQCIEEGGIICL